MSNSPVLSMSDLEIEELSINGATLTVSKSEMTHDELASVSATYKYLRDAKNETPDDELIGYILGNAVWDKLTPVEQADIVSKVTGKPIPTALEVLMCKSNISKIYKEIRASGNEASDKDLIAYLLGAEWNKLSFEDQASIVSKVAGQPKGETKDIVESAQEIELEETTSAPTLVDHTAVDHTVNLENQASVVSKVAGQPKGETRDIVEPIEEKFEENTSVPTPTDHADIENGWSMRLDHMPRQVKLTHLTLERPLHKKGRRTPSRKALPSNLFDEPTKPNSLEVDHSSEKEVTATVKPAVEESKNASSKVYGGVRMLAVDFSTLRLKKVDKTETTNK